MNRLPVSIMEPFTDPDVEMWCTYSGKRCFLVGWLCDDRPSRKQILKDKDWLYGDGTRYLIVVNLDKLNMSLGPLCWVPIQQLDTHGVLLVREEVSL